MKVICEKCESVFKAEAIKGMSCCPVCGASLDEEKEKDTSSHDEPLSFGEGIELGENDSFDEDKIDFWWYEIDEPGELGEDDSGGVSRICAKCGHLVGDAPYPIARTGDYLLISARYRGRCGTCGNEMKNHILSKRPADWVDPRKRDTWVKDYENIPKCPICSSTKIHKISLTNKAASALAFGVLAAGHVSKTYKCDTCGAEF